LYARLFFSNVSHSAHHIAPLPATLMCQTASTKAQQQPKKGIEKALRQMTSYQTFRKRGDAE